MKLQAYTLSLLAFIFLSVGGMAQAPDIVWQKTLGGSASDRATSVLMMDDGNYLVCGISQSTNGDMQNDASLTSKGGYDFWVFKVSTAGNIIWRKVFGGSGNEFAPVCVALGNNKYVVAGTTHSQNDNDVTGSFGCFGSCNDCDDVWALCIDDAGTILWKNTYGTNDFEQLRDVTVTRNKNIALLFYGYTINCTPQAPPSAADATGLILIDTNGIQPGPMIVVYGDDVNSADQPSAICQNKLTTDLTFAGATVTGLSDLAVTKGGFDFWILSLTETGTSARWQKNYGGSGTDAATSIAATFDGGYIVTGMTQSDDGDVIGNHSAALGDIWVLKLSSNGALQWSKCYGGSQMDCGLRILQQPDSSYLLLGVTASDDGDITGNHSTQNRRDYWLAVLSDTGSIVWSKTLGGSDEESFYAANNSIDPSFFEELYSPRTGLLVDESGDIVMAGATNSSDGDVTNQHGSDDYWLVKMSKNATGISDDVNEARSFSLYPNPATETITIYSSEATLETFTVTDVLGRIVLPPVKVINGQASMDIKGLAIGTYSVHGDHASDFRRFIKE